jgi:glycosyltransferase involved in cell wall biosynthesis
MSTAHNQLGEAPVQENRLREDSHGAMRDEEIRNREKTLVVFADDWGRHPSSCQHLIRRMTSQWRILWVNTIGTRSVRADGFTFRRGIEKIRSWRNGLRQVGDQMWVLDPPMVPSSSTLAKKINRVIVTTRIRQILRRLKWRDPVVLTTLPYTAWLLGDLGECGFVYYCTDDYSHWPSADRPVLQQAERQIRQRADLVLAVSHKLAALHAEAERCEYFPHGVDVKHFMSVKNVTSLPEPLRAIPEPRIGFFGLLYEKIDYALLSRLAESLPDASLVLIGPVDYCPESITKLPNVHLLGKQPYDDLPSWLAGLDVLLMPYVNDEMIRQSNPLKLRECLATGKPTVCIDIPEVRRLEPHVRVAETHEDFLAAVRQALQESHDPTWALARQRAVENDSWDVRAAELSEYLGEIAAQ